MKKEVIIGLSTILLVATPVFAAPGGNGNGKAGEAKNNHGQEVAGQKTENVPPVTLPTNVPVTVPPIQEGEPEVLPLVEEDVLITVTPTKKPNKGLEKKVEKSVQGVSTSAEECDPNAEWKNHGAYVSCVAKTHPGGEVVSAAARSDIGKKNGTPSATPSASPSPTPITSPEEEVELTTNPLETFISAIGRFFKNLPFLNKHS